jgi:hypothetical protein
MGAGGADPDLEKFKEAGVHTLYSKWSLRAAKVRGL